MRGRAQAIGGTALSYSTANQKVIEMLLANGVTVDQTDEHGRCRSDPSLLALLHFSSLVLEFTKRLFS